MKKETIKEDKNEFFESLKEFDKQPPKNTLENKKLSRTERIWYLICLIISIIVFLNAVIFLYLNIVHLKDIDEILIQAVIFVLFLYGIIYFIKKLK